MHLEKLRKFIHLVERKQTGKPVDVAKQLGLVYRYFGVFVERGRWRQILSRPLLFLQVFVLRIAVGAIFVAQKLARKPKKNYYNTGN